nr:MFS transporter [Angustibacter aerolatus]
MFTDGGLFLRASSLMQVSRQVNLVLGYAVGGTVVALVGASKALWIDAVTFALSGLLVALFVRTRPAALDGGVQGLRRLLLDLREGTSYLRRDRSLRSLVLLAWAMLLAVVAPEAVALPLAVAQGGDTRAGGVLLAAVPLGLALGAFVVGRWSPMTQVRSMLPMAALLPMPLLGLALDPRWRLVAVLYLVTGALQAFLVPLMGTFAVLAPPQPARAAQRRGRCRLLAGVGAVVPRRGIRRRPHEPRLRGGARGRRQPRRHRRRVAAVAAGSARAGRRTGLRLAAVQGTCRASTASIVSASPAVRSGRCRSTRAKRSARPAG